MAKLKDIMAGEVSDSMSAIAAAAAGRSLTGMSGRHEEMNVLFGQPANPIAGERLEQFSPESQQDLAPRRIDRADRKPFGDQEQQLAYPKRDGYRRYWFNDTPGRIARALEAGYAHVMSERNGEPIGRVTGKIDGRGQNSYLMEIPIEWYEDDMTKAATNLDRRLNDIREGRAGPGSEDGRYVPKQGISIKGR